MADQSSRVIQFPGKKEVEDAQSSRKGVVIADWHRGEHLPVAVVGLLCLTPPRDQGSNIPAAEVWYKIWAFPAEGTLGPGTYDDKASVELWCRWPCPCGEEHLGLVAKW